MKKINGAFAFIFILMITIPLATTNLETNKVSIAENRKLASFPRLYNDDGTLNKSFLGGFENWINDNIGFRSSMVLNNAKIQYYIFGELTNNSEYMLGPHGELNYIGDSVIANYQHSNLLADEDLETVINSYQVVNDYLESQGIQFYYIQNWDKQSIYPEEFPNSVNQIGDISLTDQVVSALESRTTVNVISMKDIMIEGKKTYRTYNKWADVTHWSQRGAFLGYEYLMYVLNSNNNNQFRVLNESDYTITFEDQGSTLLGGIHTEDYVESFTINNPTGYLSNEKLTLYGDADQRQTFWTNDTCGNNTRVLIFGDSYMELFLMDDLAESFYETIELWSWTSRDIVEIVNEYRPDIVIYEKAERIPAYMSDMVSAAQKINETYSLEMLSDD